MKEPKDERLCISLTTEDRKILDQLARMEDRSVASMLRTLIRRAAAERGVSASPARIGIARSAK